MKFLLAAVNAKYIHSNPAIYSLKAYAAPYSSQVELAEYTINNQEEFILQDIFMRRPDVIGFSCYIWNIAMVRHLVDDLHKVLPNVPVWLGGPEVSFDCKKLLRELPWVSGIMFGEGEKIFSHLLEYYLNGIPKREEIRGLAYREEGGEIRVNDPQEPFDLTEVPFLYEGSLCEDWKNWEHRILYYETSRGCPFRCSYCLSSVDKKVRFRDLDVVKRELDFFLEQKVPQVKLVDRTFNAKKSHGLEIWNYLLEHDNGVTNFHFEISADLLGAEEMEVLKKMRPGLVQLEIGVQTTNPETAKAICRTASFESIAKAVREINSFRNIHQHLDLIAGLPYEDYESFGRSFDQVYALKPEQLQLGFLKVLKGSPMEQQARKYEICYRSQPPYEVLSTGWLPYEDVIRLKGIEEAVEIYYNSGQFSCTMELLRKKFSSAFAMYEALAEFYKKNALSAVSHSRMARYEILKEFITSVDGEWEILYNNTLTYDSYLREKVKTRPAFAKDLSIYKEEIRRFYQTEEKERRCLKGYEAYSSRQMEHMTHLEVFDVDMERLQKTGDVIWEKTYLLFDYRQRDPLTNNAKVTRIPLGE